MNVTIKPNKLQGTVVIPPSKSLSHRAIIGAALAQGKSTISNVMFSKDILATIDAVRAIGATVNVFDDAIEVIGTGGVRRATDLIDANESGSTIRFMIPIALVSKEPIKFIGKNNLVKRPLDIFFEIFDMQGIDYKHEIGSYLPLEVKGGLKPGVFNIRGDISSQFITGLLYALPLLDNDSKIIITTEMESKGYIDLTLDMLSNFGIEIINNNYKEFIIKGNQKYLPFDYVIEGDYSQSAFFLVADMLGADITLKAMSKDSYQGDKKILSDIEEFGGNIEFVDDSLKATLNTQKNAIIDLGQSPDLGPALSVLAGLTKGNSKLINAERLRIKECDRITCVKEELNKLGMNVDETKTELIFNGVSRIKGGVVDAHNDHRVAMALAMAALKSDGDIKILGAECVSKSYPTFWDVYESLGGIISYEK